MYDAGIKAAEGIVSGLTKKKTEIENAMKVIADTLVKTIQTKLQIKSPSRVFAGVGDNIGAGLEVGINGRKRSVSKAIDGLARVPNGSALALAGGAGMALNPNVRVFIGDKELTHIVRTEVDASQDGMARQLAYGRRV
jgi:trimeric autotransporter adhesin